MFFWPNPLLLHFTVFSFSLTVPNSRKATRDFASVLAMGASSYILYQSNSEGANFLNTWWKHPINKRNKSNNNTLNNYSSVTISLLCRLPTTGPTQGVIILIRIPIFFISWFGIPFVRLFPFACTPTTLCAREVLPQRILSPETLLSVPVRSLLAFIHRQTVSQRTKTVKASFGGFYNLIY